MLRSIISKILRLSYFIYSQKISKIFCDKYLNLGDFQGDSFYTKSWNLKKIEKNAKKNSKKNPNRKSMTPVNHYFYNSEKAAVTTGNPKQQAVLMEVGGVQLKSSVAGEEHKFFVSHQKSLNKQIFSGLSKQKEQIRKIKIKLGTAELDG